MLFYFLIIKVSKRTKLTQIPLSKLFQFIIKNLNPYVILQNCWSHIILQTISLHAVIKNWWEKQKKKNLFLNRILRYKYTKQCGDSLVLSKLSTRYLTTKKPTGHCIPRSIMFVFYYRFILLNCFDLHHSLAMGSKQLTTVLKY